MQNGGEAMHKPHRLGYRLSSTLMSTVIDCTAVQQVMDMRLKHVLNIWHTQSMFLKVYSTSSRADLEIVCKGVTTLSLQFGAS